mgnify:CR=1 FL=1
MLTLSILLTFSVKIMKQKYKDILNVTYQVLGDTLVGALVFYLIHIVFMMPIIWVGIVFILSVMMRTKQYRKRNI